MQRRLRRDRGGVRDNCGDGCERIGERRMRQTPFAGIAGAVLLKVGAMLRQQPLREHQYARKCEGEQWLADSTWAGHSMFIHACIIADKHQCGLSAARHQCKLAPGAARSRRGCNQ